MIWFVLAGVAAVAGLVVGLVAVKNDRYRLKEEWFLVPFMYTFFVLVVGGITAVILNGIMVPILGGNNRPVVREIQIVQIGTGTSISGSFFLGSGYVDSDPVYTFYREDDGAISQDWIPANYYTKIYQDSTDPRVVVHDNDPRHPWWSLFNSHGKGYEVHVPPNSIDRSVNLNLNGN